MANEKRLIDANDVYALFDVNGFARLHVGDIDTIPRVDAVEVVRCKDCKHFYHSISSDRDGRCVQFGTYDTDPSVYLTDFCSYGERRTDGGTG